MATLLDVFTEEVEHSKIIPFLSFADLLRYDEAHRQMSSSLGRTTDVWMTAGLTACLEKNVSVDRESLGTFSLPEIKSIFQELTRLWGPHGTVPLCVCTVEQIKCLVSVAKRVNRQVANHWSLPDDSTRIESMNAKAVVGDFYFYHRDVQDMLGVDPSDPYLARQFFFSRDVNFTWDQPSEGTLLCAMIGWTKESRRGFEVEGLSKGMCSHVVHMKTSLFSADPRLAEPFVLEDMDVEVDAKTGVVEMGPCDLRDEANRLVFTTRPGVRCVFSVLGMGMAEPRVPAQTDASSSSTTLSTFPLYSGGTSTGSLSTMPLISNNSLASMQEGFELQTFSMSELSLPELPEVHERMFTYSNVSLPLWTSEDWFTDSSIDDDDDD